MAIDNIFANEGSMKTFEFTQEVAEVFDNMLNRSVPFYQQILTQIAQLVGTHATIYDLGCSLGGLVPFLKKHNPKFKYIGIDKSKDMLARARKFESENITFIQADISKSMEFEEPTAIICNLILQFIEVEKRAELIQRYYDALPKNGVLIIVEKVKQSDPALQEVYRESYHQLKRANGYSKKEIINKDIALESVLLSETSSYYETVLNNVGFHTIDTFFKWYNFVGFIAKK